MELKINEALDQLDPTKDSDWTENGAPAMDRIHELTGDQSITRQAVTNARSGFTRETVLKDLEENSSESKETTRLSDVGAVSVAAETVSNGPSAVKTETDDLVEEAPENKTVLDEYSERKAELSQVLKEIAECDREIKELQIRRAKLSNRQVTLQGGSSTPMTHEENQKSIQHYIKSNFERKLREHEEKQKRFEAAGLTVGVERSRLDQRISKENKAKRRGQGV